MITRLPSTIVATHWKIVNGESEFVKVKAMKLKVKVVKVKTNVC